MKRLIAAIAMTALAGTAWAGGDPQAGQAKAAACAACHGADGNSFVPNFPKLAGQVPKYIEKQLADFQSGARQDPTMAGFAAALSEQDRADLAAFFASQTLQAGSSSAAPDVLERGKKIYMGGDAHKGYPACASCHAPDGAGNAPAGWPSLRAQHPAYVVKQLNDFRSGARKNDPNKMMRQIAVQMSDADIQAVAEYIATLKP